MFIVDFVLVHTPPVYVRDNFGVPPASMDLYIVQKEFVICVLTVVNILMIYRSVT